MNIYLLQIANGVGIGMLYFLLAVGLSIVFGLLRFVNFSHGAFFLLGAYLCFQVTDLGLNFWWSLLLAPLAVGLFAWVVERFVLRHVYALPHHFHILFTVGMALVIQEAVISVWGPLGNNVSPPDVLQGVVMWSGFVYPKYRLFVIGLTAVMALLLWWVLEGTRLGSIVRAGSESTEMVSLLGLNINRIFSLVFALGAATAGLAGALAAVKLHIPVAHVEAGLRSFNLRMPEEVNRILTDRVSQWLFTPTEVAAQNLRAEGVASASIFHVGDVMYDVALYHAQRVTERGCVMEQLELAPRGYILATVHRAENTDDPARLAEIAAALGSLQHPVILLAHPRVVAKAAAHGIDLTQGSLIAHPPLAYPDLIAATLSSAGVVTDSGGLQKEAFLLRVPCTTVRPETEWVETVESGWNVLANTAEEIAAAVSRPTPAATDATPYGDGHAAERVIAELLAARS